MDLRKQHTNFQIHQLEFVHRILGYVFHRDLEKKKKAKRKNSMDNFKNEEGMKPQVLQSFSAPIAHSTPAYVKS